MCIVYICIKHNFLHAPYSFEVVGLLVSLLFSQKGLPFEPLDHVECFAGAQAVTLGEIQDYIIATIVLECYVVCVEGKHKVPKALVPS